MSRFKRLATVVLVLIGMTLAAAPTYAAPHTHASSSNVALLTVHVTEDGVAPVVGASVSVYVSKQGENLLLETLYSDASGLVTYTAKPDSYRVVVDAAGAIAPVTLDLTLVRDATYTEEVVLPFPAKVGFVEGVVVSGLSRTPMTAAYVYLYKQNADLTWPPTSPYVGAPTYSLLSDSLGRYASGELPYGNYKVRFFTMHTGSQWWQYVSTPDSATVLSIDEPGERFTGIDGWYNR